MKNILIVTGLDSSLKLGGIERWYITLSKTVDKGTRIFLFYNKALPADFITEIFENSNIYSSVFTFSEIRNRKEEFKKFVTDHQIKVVWSHFENTVDFLPYAKKIGCTTLWTLHMGNYYYTHKEWKSNFKLFVGVLLFRLKIFIDIFYIDKIYCVSNGIFHEFKNFFGHKDKFEVHYLGLEEKILKENSAAFREKKPRDGKLVVTCVAFHGKIKGVDIFIRAVAELNKRGYSEVTYNQIGGSQYLDHTNDTQELKKLAEELNVKNICWMGMQNDVQEFLRNSDIYCQPSRHEAMPFSIMEAMSVGLPIIAPNIGGIPELVKDGSNGLLFQSENYMELADEIEILINNKDLRRRMGQQSEQIINQPIFQTENNIKKILQYIKRR